MVVVKLSRTAERKKAIILVIQSIFRFEVVWRWWIKVLNPLWESMSSTIVIAPSKKNKICETSLKWAFKYRIAV